MVTVRTNGGSSDDDRTPPMASGKRIDASRQSIPRRRIRRIALSASTPGQREEASPVKGAEMNGTDDLPCGYTDIDGSTIDYVSESRLLPVTESSAV